MPRRNVTPVAWFLKVPVNTGPGRLFYVSCAYIEDQVFDRKKQKADFAENCCDKHKEM